MRPLARRFSIFYIMMTCALSACGGGGGGSDPVVNPPPPPPPAPPPPPPPPPAPPGPFSSATQQSIKADDSYWELQQITSHDLLVGWSRFVDPYDDGIRDDRLRVFARNTAGYELVTEISSYPLDSFRTSATLPVIYGISGQAVLDVHSIDVAGQSSGVLQSIDLVAELGADLSNMTDQPMFVSPDGTLFYVVFGTDVASYLINTVTGELTYQATYSASSTALPAGIDPFTQHAELSTDGSYLVVAAYQGSIVVLQAEADGSLNVVRDVILDGFVPDNFTQGFGSLDSFVLLAGIDQIVAVVDVSGGGVEEEGLISWTWDGSSYESIDQELLAVSFDDFPSITTSPAGDILLLGFREAPQLNSVFRAIELVAMTTATDATGMLAAPVQKTCPPQNAFSSYRRGLYDPSLDRFWAAGPGVMQFEYQSNATSECQIVHLPPGETSIAGAIDDVALSPDASLITALSSTPHLTHFRRQNGEFVEHQSLDLGSMIAPRQLGALKYSPDGRHLYVFGNLDILVYAVSQDGQLTFASSVEDRDDRGIAGILLFSSDGQTVFSIAKRLDQSNNQFEITPVVNSYSRDSVSGELTLQQTVLLDLSVVFSLLNDQLISAALSPDGRHLYVGVQTSIPGNQGILYVLDVEQPASMQSLYALLDQAVVPGTPLSDEVIDGLRAVSGIAVSPDGARVIVTGRYYRGRHPITSEITDTAIIEFERDTQTGQLTVSRYLKNEDSEQAGEPDDMQGGYYLPQFSSDGEFLVMVRARYQLEHAPSHGVDVYQWSGENYDFIEHVSGGGFGAGVYLIREAADSDSLAGINRATKSLEIVDFQ